MGKTVLTEKEIALAVNRIAYEVVESLGDRDDLCVVGIRSRGVPLAFRLAQAIAMVTGGQVPVGILDITVFRDDLITASTIPEARSTEIDFDVNGKRIVLVDDVLFTGRTIHAAIAALMQLGRPALIRTAVLIDRGHRELPIHADFVGKSIDTLYGESVDVFLSETDGQDIVKLKG